MNAASQSGLFVGSVRHRRFTPVEHVFSYPMFMPLIDLDDVDRLAASVKGFSTKKWGMASFYRPDYMEGREDTKQAVQDKVVALTGKRFTGKVLALCHLRYFGLYFSPVNFYYLYDEEGNWAYMLAEVSNTPWNQRHYYAVPAGKHWENDKAFHVSPFNPIDQKYVWKLRPLNKTAFVHLETHRGEREFDATLAMIRKPFTSSELSKLIAKTPVMTVKVVVSIYWQALKLWIKGAPFYGHPEQAKEKL
ncbi:DUF1365 domain-containing protein [Grimontia hollisae]|uniref:Plasmid partition ParA protein n=1 Tax=Grimontia hollisae CIP 101886 TaxID=675812 RepID=D0I5J8_GRIHO|nr:DUF1365 domain-containing protein [Grimontia hollisae]AMG29227.1 DUF1365 domain-containing protein [Grimontia hollisae]EEY73162.1 hypothetical protein VHA_001015 [Grimontia hollisae CIP 101886]STO76639.1 Protein of uncharacterised function (DUF1365) [Grimontia hollisae]